MEEKKKKQSQQVNNEMKWKQTKKTVNLEQNKLSSAGRVRLPIPNGGNPSRARPPAHDKEQVSFCINFNLNYYFY